MTLIIGECIVSLCLLSAQLHFGQFPSIGVLVISPSVDVDKAFYSLGHPYGLLLSEKQVQHVESLQLQTKMKHALRCH